LKNDDSLNLSAELKRKTIHLSCSILPLLYYFFLGREQIVLLSGIISITFLVGEYCRVNIQVGQRLFKKLFYPLLRADEKQQQLTGATYLFLSATITFFFFEKTYAIPAILILTISDSMAAIIGKMVGRKRFFNKSVEGSITFFLCSFFIMLIFTPLFMGKILFVALLLTIIEAAATSRMNDNLIISISAAVLMVFVSKF
jgi:dolichol kinase